MGKKQKINLLYWLIVITFGWLTTCNIIQTLKCPEMTQTELFYTFQSHSR